MKKIFLWKGRHGAEHQTDIFVLVDDADYERLNQHRWWLMKLYHCDSGITYARRYERPNGKTVAILMHRQVLEVTERKTCVDHINGDTMDNRRENLRTCSHSENMKNRVQVKTGKSSKYKGVGFYGGRWRGEVMANGSSKTASFDSEKEAAEWYNKMAPILHGEFAKLNVIQ